MLNPTTLRKYSLSIFILSLSSVILIGCNDSGVVNDSDVSLEPTTVIHTHETPGETCFIEDASKRDPQRLWCNEHGRYEDRCFVCHPEIEDKERLYCTEHFLYEDECFLCRPELLNQNEAADPEPQARGALEDVGLLSKAELSDRTSTLYCNEHDVNEDECGVCHPDLLSTKTIGESMKVRFASSESAKKAGVRTGPPNQASITPGEASLGRTSFNMNRLALVTPFASGVIRNVVVDVGQSVEKGQLLAEVNSPALADAKSAFIKALVDEERTRRAFEREEGLLKREVSSRKDYENAEASYSTSISEVDRTRQQLFNLGLNEVEVGQVEKTRSASSVLPLRAPFDGSIVEREAVLGMAVEVGTHLFQIADLSSMWLELSVAESLAVQLQPGVDVHATFDAFPDRTFDGELIWVASHIDEFSRTIKARALLPNSDNHLKSGLFGSAVIAKDESRISFTLPSDALQTIDGQTVIFAKLEDDLYEARVVRTGPVQGDLVAITEGLFQNDEIALSESYILKSELLKARLGAGCVDE